MKKAFSLFEIIIAVVIISIISSYFLFKSEDSLEYSNKIKIKSDVALIRSSIQKQKTSKVLLNQDIILKLDDEPINEEGSSLFQAVLDMPLISTSTLKKELGKWIKVSSNEYEIFLNNQDSLKFKFESSGFNCQNDIEICKEFE